VPATHSSPISACERDAGRQSRHRQHRRSAAAITSAGIAPSILLAGGGSYALLFFAAGEFAAVAADAFLRVRSVR